MARNFLTDEAVEKEIERLSESEAVKLARRELRLKYKRRQTLYTLRALEKRGKELAEAGITMENIDMMMALAEAEEAEA
jgi:SOS response regulatory protein OraA/RecX